MAKKNKEEKAKEVKYTKQQLLKSKRYVNRQDALTALLNDDKTYSHQDVEKILNDFYKGGKK
ncbi:hypothetical protein [Gracilibacillus dipsosauri]|uniref:hypothetical protein n=1 Tax=Gracilibacillus dipsosauri TaxID=178340 RepID=UPI00240A69FF